MSNQSFRDLVLRYCKEVNKSQRALASELSLNHTFFSNKLNENNKKQLTLAEIKSLVRILVKWQAINSPQEIEDLLKEKDLKLSIFSKEELGAFGFRNVGSILEPIKVENLKQYKKTPHNLPAQTTNLIGREDDAKTVRSILLGPNTRLLTLTGPGGTGKTRLSLQVGREMLKDFEDGVFFIELAAITNVELVPQAIANVLGIKEISDGLAVNAIKSWLGNQRILLILDNFEQILGASIFVAELLMAAPNLKILVTSREVLHIYVEHRLIVTTLGLPDTNKLPNLETLSKYPAIALFIDRAKAVRPDFSLNISNFDAVSQICAYLEGLPLAIELVAVRSNLFTPQGLLSRLKRHLFKITNGSTQDFPKRHQSLENAIDWSYDLLNETEKEILLRLAIFPASGSLESIEAICNIEDDLPIEVFEILSSLSDKSLLSITFDQNGESRFGMLATVREYLLEKLVGTGYIEKLRGQYTAYFLSLAEDAAEHFNKPDQAIWFDRLSTEFPNLNAAIENALTGNDIPYALRLVGALGRFWQIRGHLSVGLLWLTTVLDRAENLDAAFDLLKAKAANMLALIYLTQGELESSKKYYDWCLPQFEAANDGLGISACYKGLGNIAYYKGNFLLALEYYEKGLNIFRHLGNKKEIADYLSNMGVIASTLEDFEKAHNFSDESLSLRRELGDKLDIASSLNNIALIWLNRGEFKKAYNLHEESLALRREMGHKLGVADSLQNIGEVCYFQGELVAAVSYFNEAKEINGRSKNLVGYGITVAGLASVYEELGDYENCARCCSENLAIKLEHQDNRGFVNGLEDYAYLLASAGEFHQSAKLLGFIVNNRRENNIIRRQIDEPKFQRKLNKLRNQFQVEEFGQYFEAGASFTLDNVIKMVPLADLKQILTGYV